MDRHTRPIVMAVPESIRTLQREPDETTAGVFGEWGSLESTRSMNTRQESVEE